MHLVTTVTRVLGHWLVPCIISMALLTCSGARSHVTSSVTNPLSQDDCAPFRTEASPTLASMFPALAYSMCNPRGGKGGRGRDTTIWFSWPYANWPCGLRLDGRYQDLRRLLYATAPPMPDAITAIVLVDEQRYRRVSRNCLKRPQCLEAIAVSSTNEITIYHDPARLPKRYEPLIYLATPWGFSGIEVYKEDATVGEILTRTGSATSVALRDKELSSSWMVLVFRVVKEDGGPDCYRGPFGAFPRYVLATEMPLESGRSLKLEPWDMVVVRDTRHAGVFVVGEVQNPGVYKYCGGSGGLYWFAARPTVFSSTVVCYKDKNAFSEASCGFVLGEGAGVVVTPNLHGLAERCTAGKTGSSSSKNLANAARFLSYWCSSHSGGTTIRL